MTFCLTTPSGPSQLSTSVKVRVYYKAVSNQGHHDFIKGAKAYGACDSGVGSADFVVRVDIKTRGPASTVGGSVARRLPLFDGTKKIMSDLTGHARERRCGQDGAGGDEAKQERRGAEEGLHHEQELKRIDREENRVRGGGMERRTGEDEKKG